MVPILYLAFLILQLVCGVHGQDPRIPKEILPEIRRQGETGRLTCVVINQQNYKVYWIYNKRHLVISSDDKVNLDPKLNEKVKGWPKYDVEMQTDLNMNIYTLVIRRLILLDAGLYTCMVNVRGLSVDLSNPAKTGNLTVISPPSIVQALTTHTLTVEEGSNITLNCDATGFPTPNITWVRANGSPLPAPINEVRYRGKKIEILDVEREDRGVYRCLADNNVRPPGRHDVTLYVNFQPYARAVQSSYGQAQNRMFDVVIECRIQGQPEPDLMWYHVSEQGYWTPIRWDDKHRIHVLLSHGNQLETSEYWFQLHIINVQAGDYGDYICEGTNRLGKHHATVYLFETSECQGANCPWGGEVTGGSQSVTVFPWLPLVTLAGLALLLTRKRHY